MLLNYYIAIYCYNTARMLPSAVVIFLGLRATFERMPLAGPFAAGMVLVTSGH